MPEPAPRRTAHRGTLSTPTARGVACQALAQQAERFPDLVTIELPTRGLEPRDAALAHAMYDVGIRRWITIAYLCEKALSRPWGNILPPLQGALLAGGTQLLFMDRVPAYAAINESVEWAKRMVSPGGAGLVNAALRALTRLVHESPSSPVRAVAETFDPAAEHIPLPDGRALVLATPVLPPDLLPRLAVQTSHPRALLESWAATHTPSVVHAMAMHALCDPPIILNIAHADVAQLDNLSSHARPGSAVFTGPHTNLASVLGANPNLWVQDPSSSEAVRSVSDLRPVIVVDLCAGQGTKTRQLAHTFPKARIIATDTDETRMRTLREVARALPSVQVLDMDRATSECARGADLVVLDVPCSNTGVLARRPEARYRAVTAQLPRLVELQRQILRTGASLLRPGGTLLYATCSIEPAENEQQAAWAGAELGLALQTQRSTLPAGQPGGPATTYHDGSFSARLVRS